MNTVASTYSGKVVCMVISSSAKASWATTYGVQFTIAKDNGGATASAYGVPATPHNVIVDQQGDIAWERTGGTGLSTFTTQIDALNP